MEWIATDTDEQIIAKMKGYYLFSNGFYTDSINQYQIQNIVFIGTKKEVIELSFFIRRGAILVPQNFSVLTEKFLKVYS